MGDVDERDAWGWDAGDLGGSAGPLLPLIPSQKFRTWPKHRAVARRVAYLAMEQLLAGRYAFDAHTAQYSVPAQPYRLSDDPPAYDEVVDGVAMVVAIFDVDCAQSHRASGGDANVPAPDEWWALEHERVARLRERHPGLFAYRTRGGYRIVARLPAPISVHAVADKDVWCTAYCGWVAYLARAFGIVADPACRDWTHLFRLPHATRDGGERCEDRDVVGDPRDVGLLEYDPTPEERDLDRRAAMDIAAREQVRLASLPGRTNQWAHVVRYLTPRRSDGPSFSAAPGEGGVGDSPPGPGEAASGAPPRRERPPRPVEPIELDDEAAAAIIARLGGALATYNDTTGVRHPLHLALAGACVRRGLDPRRAGDFGVAIARCAGDDKAESRRSPWVSTASKFVRGEAHTGYRTLRASWPEVAKALDEVLPDVKGARRVRVELDARGTFEEVSADEGVEMIRRAIEGHTGGLLVLRANEGVGKSRVVVDVAARRARRSSSESRQTVIVVPQHGIADEVVASLAARGVATSRHRSPFTVTTANGKPACVVAAPARRLANSGHAAVATLCHGRHMLPGGGNAPCDYRRKCPALDGAVERVGEGQDPAVTVTVRGLLDSVQAIDTPDALVVFDEDAGAIETTAISPRDLYRTLDSFDRYFAGSDAFRKVALAAVQAGLREEDRDEGATLMDVFRRGYARLQAEQPDWFRGLLRPYEARDADGVALEFAYRVAFRTDVDDRHARRLQWAPTLLRWVRRTIFAAGAYSGPVEHASRVCADLARAFVAALRPAPPGGVPCDERAVVSVDLPGDGDRDARPSLRIVRADAVILRALRRPGPTVLADATCDPDVLRRLVDREVRILDVRARDSAPVERVLLYAANASRAKWIPRNLASGGVTPRWNAGLARYFAAAIKLALANAPPRPRVALFTWLALEQVIATAWASPEQGDPDAVRLLAPLRAAGAELLTGHYGATRSRNRWNDCDAYIGLGDPRANIMAVRAIAGALGMRAEWREVYRRATAAESSQSANGRARAPRRTRPATIVVVGTVPPSSWDARARVLALPPGAREEVAPAAMLAVRETYGTAAAAAEVVGLSRTRVAQVLRRVEPRAPLHASVPEESARVAAEGEEEAAGAADARRLVEDAVGVAGGVRALARELAVSAGAVSQWHHGKRSVPTEVLGRLRTLIASDRRAAASHEVANDDGRRAARIDGVLVAVAGRDASRWFPLGTGVGAADADAALDALGWSADARHQLAIACSGAWIFLATPSFAALYDPAAGVPMRATRRRVVTERGDAREELEVEGDGHRPGRARARAAGA